MFDVSFRNSAGEATKPVNELYANRIVLLDSPIDDVIASACVCQLLALDLQAHDPILLVVSSPGGSVSAGLEIIDIMRAIDSPVWTVALGTAASMGATILACGEPGHRFAAPNASILIHQPLMSGVGGSASDVEIAVNRVIGTKAKLNGILADASGRTHEEVEAATDRDRWMTPDEAREFGLVDNVGLWWQEA